MPVRNPKYNPDWEKIHDFHAEQRARLNVEISGLTGRDVYGEYLDALRGQREKHDAIVQGSFEMQHPTVQEYAAWLFRDFDFRNAVGGHGMIPVQVLDFEKMKSVEEVKAEHDALTENIRQTVAENYNKMRVGQPEKIDGFSQNAMSYGRNFSAEELGGADPVAMLISIDQKDGHNYICLGETFEGGHAALKHLDKIATILYKEALTNDQKAQEERLKAQSATGFCGFFKSAAAILLDRPNPALAPERFHFFSHVPPAPDWRESFAAVHMKFDEEQYHSPQWECFNVVPKAVHQARFDVMKEAGPAQRPTMPAFRPSLP